MARRCRSNAPAKLGAPSVLAEKRRRRPIPGDSCREPLLRIPGGAKSFLMPRDAVLSVSIDAHLAKPGGTKVFAVVDVEWQNPRTLFCYTLGPEVTGDARFCSKCGSAVDVDPDATALG